MKKLLLFSIAAISWAQAPIASPFATGTGGGGGGSGTVTDVTISGTANQITVTGASCVGGTTSINCTLSIPSDFRLPGTINKLTLTQPATGATLTITDGKTVVVNNTLTVQATDGTTVVFPAPASVTTGNCMEWTKSGSTLTLTDAGAPCSAGTGDAAAEINTTCSGATVTFTGTSNTSNGFKCVLVATNVTSSTLAGLTTGQTNTISITQPAGGGITFAAITGLTGFTPITTGAGDAANEVCSVAFKADSATTGHVVGVQNCNGGTPGITIPGSTSGSMTIVAPATGGGTATGFPGSDTIVGLAATQTLTNKTMTAPDINDGNINVDGGTLEVPNSDTLPGTCTVGQSYMDTNATSGSRWYLCESTNTWVAQGASSSSSYYPQYSCIDNTTGWSDYNYGTQMTITALQNTAGSNCGIFAGFDGSDYIRARVKATGSSTFNAKYAIRLGPMIGDGAEAGVLVKDSGTQSVTCGLNLSSGSNRFIWKGDRYTAVDTTGAAETINSIWTVGGAQYVLAVNLAQAYFSGQGIIYLELASTDGTTTTCRASFDGVIWLPVWSSTFLTPASTGYYTRTNFSTTDNIVVLGMQ